MMDTAVCATAVSFPSSRYTGKERDSESGNDYFDARYYSSSMGRFMSPDWSAKQDPVPYAKLDDPQSLNLYAYVRNNPLTRVDADGHCDANDWGCNSWTSGSPQDMARQQAQQPAQQQSGPTLPQNPSGLGSGWKDVTPKGGTNPKIPKRFRGPKGTEIEFDPGVAGKPGWGGKDHWHGIGPDGKREDGHLAPGAPIPGPDGVPEPEPAPQAPEPSQSPFSDWVHDQWQGFKNYLRDHPYGPNSSPGPYVPPLVPIPVPLIP